MGAEGRGPLGQAGHSPHVGEELLEPLLPVHRPELEPGCGVARVTQAVMKGPVLVERQAEAGAVKEAVALAAHGPTHPGRACPHSLLLHGQLGAL